MNFSPWKSKVTYAEEKRMNNFMGYAHPDLVGKPQPTLAKPNVSKGNFGTVKIKQGPGPQSVLANSNAGIPKFLTAKLGPNDTHRSMNSIEKELKELEYLKLMKNSDKRVFKEFLNEKREEGTVSKWYKQQMFQHYMTKTHIERLHDLYDPAHTHSFTPEINAKSRVIAKDYQNELKLNLKKSKSANRTQSMVSYKESKLERPAKHFDPAEFNNHMVKINAWNKANNSTLVRNFVRNFNRRPDQKPSYVKVSKSASQIETPKTRPGKSKEELGVVGTVHDYFVKDTMRLEPGGRSRTELGKVYPEEGLRSQKVTFS